MHFDASSMARLGFGTAFMLAGCGASAPAPRPVEIAAGVVSEDAYPERRVVFPGGVTGLPDRAYTSEPGYRPLTLDLYLPPGSPGAGVLRPFVVFVHGGGWVGGSPRTMGAFRNWPEVLASLAARGYVVASVSYRLAHEAPFPAALLDVKAAIRWLRAHAADFDLDEARGVIWGPSAGGYLAALTALSCDAAALRSLSPSPASDVPAGVERNPPPPPTEQSECMQGAVVWNGVSDLTTFEGAEASALLGCEAADCTSRAAREVARVASPITYVDGTDPPVLILHGSADRVVPSQQAERLYEALRASRVAAQLELLPEIDHSFLGPTPEATRDASLEALERTIAFIDATIGDGRASLSPVDLPVGLSPTLPLTSR